MRLLPAIDGVVAVGVDEAVQVGWNGELWRIPRRVAAVAGRGLYASLDDDFVVLTDRADDIRATIPIAGRRLVGLRPIFDDRLIAMRLQTSNGDEVWVTTSAGAVAHRIDAGVVQDWAVAENKGLALLLSGDRLRSLCLRTGRLLRTAPSPEVGARSIDIDASANGLLVAGDSSSLPLSVVHVDFDEAMSARPRDQDPAPSRDCPVPSLAPIAPVEPVSSEIPELRFEGLEPSARSTLSARQRRELLDAEIRQVGVDETPRALAPGSAHRRGTGQCPGARR